MNWVEADYSTVCPEKARLLRRKFEIGSPLPEMLIKKGIDSVGKMIDYLAPEPSLLHNPFLMNDMRKAVYRIVRAIREREVIFIFGDYDCDGITSTALLYKGIRDLKGTVRYQLPLRSEGYGLTPEAVRRIAEEGATLIITVDNGTSAKEAMTEAKARGIDVIVTDHHEVLNGRPDCYAFLNPKRKDNQYPFNSLCGAGVAFKLLHALFIVSKYDWSEHYLPYTALAAIGTIADMVPLEGENRTITYLGLQALNWGFSPCIKKLLEGLRHKGPIDSTMVSFTVAPVFNSAGRISDPNQVVEALLLEDPPVSVMTHLMKLNAKRKQMTYEQTQLAVETILAKNLHDQNVIVVAGPFHEGIIGLIASRISDRFKRPSIVIAEDNGKGSARSGPNPEFSIISTIQRCGMHLVKFGGHHAAAGLTINMQHLDSFAQAIQESARLEPAFEPCLKYDHELPPRYVYSDHKLCRRTQWLEPFGYGNPKPVFLSRGVYVERVESFGKTETHLKFKLPRDRQALCFGRGGEIDALNDVKQIDMLFSYEPNGSILILDYRPISYH